MDYNGTSNVSPVRASSVTDKLFYKTEYKTSKEQWSFIRFIKPASVWSGHVQNRHEWLYWTCPDHTLAGLMNLIKDHCSLLVLYSVL